MKVRISGNSIRFRLKEPEVKQLEQTGKVSEALEFGHSSFDQVKFTLAETANEEISIQFVATEITVFVPKILADTWATTEIVGFDARVETGKSKTISILVEKDFMCMDGREEENAGSYRNPLMQKEPT
jgi:hypothetical protein